MTYEYTYDDNNNLIKDALLDSNGDFLETTEYTYDDNGNKIKGVQKYWEYNINEDAKDNYKLYYIPRK